jgi:hypothetical protein
LMTAILTVVRWNVSVIMICTSIMRKNVEHFFRYLLAICTSSENCLFDVFPKLFVGLPVLLVFVFWQHWGLNSVPHT